MKKSFKYFVGIFSFVLVCGIGTAYAYTVVTGTSVQYGPDQHCQVNTTYSYRDPDGSTGTYTLIKGGTTRMNSQGITYCDTAGAFKNDTRIKDVSVKFDGNNNLVPFSDSPVNPGAKNNNDVGVIQIVLLNEGFVTAVDGNFGPSTKTGLMKFQAKYNLIQTGTFDAQTKTLMEQKLRDLGRKGESSTPTQKPAPSAEVSLNTTTTALQKIKNEISELTKSLSKLSQQASALMATLPNN